jgi:fructosamine-3-kinase
MKDIISGICKQAGLNYLQHNPVHGGDISKAFKLETTEGSFFLKINDVVTFPGMFQKEADGLDVISKTGAILTPAVKGTGEFEGAQWLLLEWLNKETPSPVSWKELGHNLAALHKHSTAQFGWPYHNYIGSLQQQNTWCDSWEECYRNNRVMPLIKKLFDASFFSITEVKAAENLFKRISDIYPVEPSSLLHGDLWSGNFMIAKKGRPVVFDPAIYYGHREMDIAMTKLFGGFDSSFYHSYNDVFPLQNGWEKRIILSQLYPLLVHAVLFGGSYIRQCSAIVKSWQ